MSETAPGGWIRWPGYLAWAFLALLLVSIMVVRGGMWMEGLMGYALSGLLSLLLLVFMAVQSLIPRWREDRRAILVRALPAIPAAALLLMALTGPEVPAIHDISTDTVDPPTYEAAVALRGSNSNPLDIKPDVIEQQLEAYPDVTTIRSQRSYASSYSLALTTAEKLGWEITRQDPNAGYIEAVETTAIMQFKDDIVIRVRTNADGSLVDLRSVSRVGRSDLGANAARILKFADVFQLASQG